MKEFRESNKVQVITLDGEAALAAFARTLQSLAESGNSLGDFSLDIKNVTEIPERVFSDCNELRSVILGEGLLKIDEAAFWSCENLISVEFPNTLEEVMNSAFAHCINLLEAKLDHTKLEDIRYGAFRNCVGLRKLSLPDTLGSFDDEICIGCVSLAELRLPRPRTGSALTGRDSESMFAFSGCISLYHLVLPPELIEVGYYAFWSAKVRFVSCPGRTPEQGRVFLKDSPELLEAYERVLECNDGLTVKVDHTKRLCDAVYQIRNSTDLEYADWVRFNSEQVISRFIVHPGCKDIIIDGDNCPFDNAVTVRLLEGVEHIGPEVFKDCRHLRVVTIPRSVTEIGKDAFNNGRLDAVFFPGRSEKEIEELCRKDHPELWVGYSAQVNELKKRQRAFARLLHIAYYRYNCNAPSVTGLKKASSLAESVSSLTQMLMFFARFSGLCKLIGGQIIRYDSLEPARLVSKEESAVNAVEAERKVESEEAEAAPEAPKALKAPEASEAEAQRMPEPTLFGGGWGFDDSDGSSFEDLGEPGAAGSLNGCF